MHLVGHVADERETAIGVNRHSDATPSGIGNNVRSRYAGAADWERWSGRLEGEVQAGDGQFRFALVRLACQSELSERVVAVPRRLMQRSRCGDWLLSASRSRMEEAPAFEECDVADLQDAGWAAAVHDYFCGG